MTVLSLHYTYAAFKVVFLRWQSSDRPNPVSFSPVLQKLKTTKRKISFSIHWEEKQQFIVKKLRIGQTCNSLIEKEKEQQQQTIQVIPVYKSKYFGKGMFANCKLKMTSHY